MTDNAIWIEYLEREAEANNVILGADPLMIMETLAEDAGIPLEKIKEVVRERTLNRAAG